MRVPGRRAMTATCPKMMRAVKTKLSIIITREAAWTSYRRRNLSFTWSPDWTEKPRPVVLTCSLLSAQYFQITEMMFYPLTLSLLINLGLTANIPLKARPEGEETSSEDHFLPSRISVWPSAAAHHAHRTLTCLSRGLDFRTAKPQ